MTGENDQRHGSDDNSQGVQQAGLAEANRLAIERQRESIIQRLETWMGTLQAPDLAQMDLYEADTSLQRGNSLFKQLEDVQLAVVGAAAGVDVVSEYGQRFMQLEATFYQMLPRLSRRIGELRQAEQQAARQEPAPGGAAAAAPVANQPAPTFRLEIPTQYQNMKNTWGQFDGTLLKWLNFCNHFTSAVHSVEDMAPRVKFQFLKEAMVGEAARCLGGAMIDDAGYLPAWEKLNKRFGPKYPLVRVYLDWFQSLKQLTTPASYDELQRLADIANETKDQLALLGVPVAQWDAYFVHNLHARLDEVNAAKWEEERKEVDFPTMDQMITFIERRANSLRSAGVVQQSLKVVIENERATYPSPPASQASQRSTSSQGKDGSSLWCPLHSSYGHQIWDCQKFLSKSLKQRKEVVDSFRLCPNCLKTGHGKDQCWDGRRCSLPSCSLDNRHNSLLCPYKSQSMQAMNVNTDQPSSSSDGGYWSRGRGRSNAFKRPGSRQE